VTPIFHVRAGADARMLCSLVEDPVNKERGDRGTGAESGGDDREPDWVDRHLVKILVVVAVVCCIGLIGRAMTG
jgi:hypothetical protein